MMFSVYIDYMVLISVVLVKARYFLMLDSFSLGYS